MRHCRPSCERVAKQDHQGGQCAQTRSEPCEALSSNPIPPKKRDRKEPSISCIHSGVQRNREALWCSAFTNRSAHPYTRCSNSGYQSLTAVRITWPRVQPLLMDNPSQMTGNAGVQRPSHFASVWDNSEG
jgi:hypothetical protein